MVYLLLTLVETDMVYVVRKIQLMTLLNSHKGFQSTSRLNIQPKLVTMVEEEEKNQCRTGITHYIGEGK